MIYNKEVNEQENRKWSHQTHPPAPLLRREGTFKVLFYPFSLGREGVGDELVFRCHCDCPINSSMIARFLRFGHWILVLWICYFEPKRATRPPAFRLADRPYTFYEPLYILNFSRVTRYASRDTKFILDLSTV